MKKTMRKIALIAAIAVGFALSACPTDTKPKTYTVTFNADNGTANTTQSVTEGGTVNKPSDPTKANDVAGLYAGTPPASLTLDGWYNGGTKWDFTADTVTGNITLTAKWTAPTIIDLTSTSGNNIVEKAVSYIKTPANAGTYTLLLDIDVDLAPQTLDAENVKLTLIGIGGEKKIKLSVNGTLFTVGASGKTGIEMILGNNITLVGRSAEGNGNEENDEDSPVIFVDYANFTMLDGSKITGNSTSPFYAAAVSLASSTFTIKGGTVSGNRNTGTDYLCVGGVRAVGVSNIIKLEGGTISGNTGNADVFFSVSNSCTLSGNAVIGTFSMLAYSSSGTSYTPYAAIASGWSGNITRLNLIGNTDAMNDVIGFYNGKEVLKADTGCTLTAADVAKFPLGDFISNTGSTQPIGNTHKLELDTTNNVIKLVGK